MNAIKLKILNLLREINELEKNIMIISIYEQENEKIKENTNLITKKKEEIVNLEKQLNEKIEKEKEKEKYKKENIIKENEAEKNKMKNMDDTMGEMKVNTYDININNNNNNNIIMNDIRAKNIEKNKKEMKLNEEKKRLKKEKLIGVNI